MRTPSPQTPFMLLTFILALVLFPVLQSMSQNPVVTARFANPEYVCATQTYSLDVEFQCNTSSKEIYGVNIRFYYDDEIMEFLNFGEITTGYGLTNPNPPLIDTDTTGEGLTYFGLDGPWEYVNGAITKITETPYVYISTTGWTKLFTVNFQLEDPEAMHDSTFCPSVIWDLKENPAEGGFRGGGGLVISIVTDFPYGTIGATEHVDQFNWQYDYVPGLPFGNPTVVNCISTLSSYAPKTILPYCGLDAPGVFPFPVTVVDFLSIKSFSILFRYDPLVMTYIGNTPNPIFNITNGYLTVTEAAAANGLRRITMTFNGLNTISLADNAILCNFQFNYLGGDGAVGWRTNSNGCTYYGPGSVLKCDQPYTDYFIDGGIVNMLAPITKIDSAAAVAGNFHTFQARTWDFDDINGGNLTLTYNPGVLIFQEALPNPALGSTFETDLIYPGLLQFSWAGNDTTLSDSSILMHITFQYLGGNSTLSWINDGFSSQFFHCNILTPMTDIPTGDYYFNGDISSSVYIWTGENSSDWDSGENWVNSEAPNEFMDVIIDPVINPENWPVFNGDFTLGEDCNNLIMSGNAQLIINGNMIIEPGHALSQSGNGIIKINGDWINSGIFNPGSGIIEFTGVNDAVIAQGLPAGNYLSNYSRTAFTADMTPIAGGLAGPTGNNTHSDVAIGFSFSYLGLSYSMARINSNGWISLDLSGIDEQSADNSALFNTALPTTALAPWWDDLLPDASTAISYKTEGTAPARIFTAEWNNILAYSVNATTRLNFQVRLYETLNMIEFIYGDVVSGSHSPDEGASIGVKDATGGEGNYIEATQNSTNVILTSLNSTNNWPSVNYRFLPPASANMEIFHKIIVSKPGANLSIQRDVKITGVE